MNCIRCKKEIEESSLFCNFCGKRQGRASPKTSKRRRRPNNTGTVYMLSGTRKKPWVAYYKNVIGTYSSSSEAVLALDNYLACQLQRDSYNATFDDIYQRWSKTHYTSISAKGKYSYESAYDTAKALHNIKMRELKTSHFQSIIDLLVAAGRSRSLCEKQKQLFSQLCKYAMQEDLIDKNYAEFMKLPEQALRKTRILSDKEIGKIEQAVTDKRLGDTAKIALVLVYTGMRINELLQLKLENLYLDEGYVIGGEKTEAGRNRCIPIHPSILPYFKEWAGKNAVWLIESTNGNARNDANVRTSFVSLMKKLCIEDVTPHTCRHTAGSLMVRSGIQPEVIQAVLGHADYSTTVNIYTHLDYATLVKGMAALKIETEEKKDRGVAENEDDSC